MDWRGRRKSSNVEDRRGQPLQGGAGPGLFLLMRILPWLLRTKGGRVLLGIGVLGFVGAQMLGIDLLQLTTGPTAAQQTPLSAEDNEMAEFVAVVLADTEQTWQNIFAAAGNTYQEPQLVLFSQRVASACGTASSAVGPFYCPADRKVYLDLTFFRDLDQQLGAPGDFAQAYVIAHEVGHHVQTLLGISEQVRARRQRLSTAESNALSVRQELQADCFAGLWGHSANKYSQMLQPGDLEEALRAASAIGDDRLQKRSGGDIVPDSFTHGTSAQRMAWFRRGFDSGDIAQCDPFTTPI